jgi:hypothetical protein
MNTSNGNHSHVSSNNNGGNGTAEEQYPAIPANSITLSMINIHGERMNFAMNPDMCFAKLFDAYATRAGVTIQMLLFRFRTEILNDTHTPTMIGMEHGDEIEVFSLQNGY